MKSQGEVVKLRTRIVVVEPGRTLAKCMSCGAEVEVPLSLTRPLIEEPEISSIPLRHYITK